MSEEPAILHTEENVAPSKSRWILLGIAIATMPLLVFGVGAFQNTATANFPFGDEVVVSEGESIDAISKKLEDASYIRSPLLFKALARHLDADTMIKAGSYTFNEPYTTYELIERLREGSDSDHGVRMTFPEGYSVHDFDRFTLNRFEQSDTHALLPLEGTLFPDTYFVAPDESLESLVARMQRHYEETIDPLRQRMSERGYSEEEVIIFASILEREANDEASMRMVAGILENRLKADMPLQVDAVFEYYTGKGSADLTLEDLQNDTPYNTYTNLGLPPEPIGNPGLMAIEAVLNPTPSSYYYYLTGNDGNFYYAETFEGHKVNKERYLR
jgi:UPF0755 protein